MGLALGQVLIGPVSDRFGRRPPLFAGLAAFIVAAAGCSLMPSIYGFLACRFIQGLGGAAGIVISRAIVRDLYSGSAAARFFSMLMTVVGVGPLLAPQLGAALLALGSWRMLFAALAGAGLVLLGVAYVLLPETLPADRRSDDTAAATLRTLRRLPVPDLVLPGHPRNDPVPQDAALSSSEWESMLEAGIHDMERLVGR